MDRAFQFGASGTPPALPVSPSIGYPQAVSGGPVTTPGPYWYHMMTEEIRGVLTAAGITPDAANLTQLSAAVKALAARALVDDNGSYPATSVGARLQALDAALTEAVRKSAQHHTAEDEGGDLTGTNPASAAMNDAFAESHVVYGVPESLLTFADVVLNHNQAYRGENTRVNAAAGANLFRLKGIDSSVADLYVADALALTGAVVRSDEGRGQIIENIVSPNTGAGFLELNPVSGSAALTRVVGNIAEGITGFGMKVRSSCNDSGSVLNYLAGKIDFVLGLGKPRAGSIGYDHSTPVVGGLAVGGHQNNMLTLIGLATGAKISYGQYLRFNDWIIDSITGYGLEVDNASTDVEFGKLFVGTSGGIKVSGASVVAIDQLTTRNNGVVPPWGQAAFYDNVGQIYDVTVQDTSELRIRGWRGDKRVSVAATAKLTVEGGQWERFRSRVNVPAGNGSTPTSYFLGPNGIEANEADAVLRIREPGWLFVVLPFVTVAPGPGETFTYTARISGADKTTVVISGAAQYDGREFAFNIPVVAGNDACVKLTLSANAAASRHDCSMQFLPK